MLCGFEVALSFAERLHKIGSENGLILISRAVGRSWCSTRLEKKDSCMQACICFEDFDLLCVARTAL